MSYLVRTFFKTTSRENEFKRVGTYESIDQAIAAAQQTIDRSLLRLLRPDTSNEALFQRYEAFGDIPCIFQVGDYCSGGVAFNPLEYAIARSAAICVKTQQTAAHGPEITVNLALTRSRIDTSQPRP